MSDQRSAIEPAAEELKSNEVESGQPDPVGDQDTQLAPTTNTRMRPSALDLARAFD